MSDGMTDANKADELVKKFEERQGETPDPVDMPAKDPTADIAYGYTIGVNSEGGVFFQVHGEQQGAVELLGLHGLARRQIEALIDTNFGQGNVEILQALNVIFKKLVDIEGKPAPATDE